MRLFVGIELDYAMKAAVETAVTGLRKRLRRSCPGLDARWVDVRQIHITLWFLGEVADERARAIISSLDAPFDVSAFDLVVGGCGVFPPSGAPRVIWLGVARGGNEMRALHDTVAVRLLPLGFEPERRPYSAHLTLARIKEARQVRRQEILAAAERLPAVIGTCRIDAVTVFRSRLSPKGAQYESLLRIPLGR
jgi:RNA 2',3'-cyclic 3'-phosphodiesterase